MTMRNILRQNDRRNKKHSYERLILQSSSWLSNVYRRSVWSDAAMEEPIPALKARGWDLERERQQMSRARTKNVRYLPTKMTHSSRSKSINFSRIKNEFSQNHKNEFFEWGTYGSGLNPQSVAPLAKLTKGSSWWWRILFRHFSQRRDFRQGSK